MCLCRLSEYRNDSLNQYFKEDALLFPVETITRKSPSDSYQTYTPPTIHISISNPFNH